jgi:hypothetical protein
MIIRPDEVIEMVARFERALADTAAHLAA